MASWTLSYPLTANLSPVGGTDVSGTALANTGNSFAAISAGELVIQSGSSGSISLTRYVQLTLTPDVSVSSWSPSSLTMQLRRYGGSATTTWEVRTSADGYAAALASGSATVNTMTGVTVPLSSLGALTGPLTVRFYVRSATGAGTGLATTTWLFSGSSIKAGGVALAAPSIASTLTIGTPTRSVPVKALAALSVPSTLTWGLASLSEPIPDPVLWVDLPTGADVLALLGRPGAGAAAQAHVDVITALARAHTRGNGFGIGIVRAGIRAVILAASARLLANPEQVVRQVGNVSYSAPFIGWTLPERSVLDDYRRTTR